jgi:hypothetical protein
MGLLADSLKNLSRIKNAPKIFFGAFLGGIDSLMFACLPRRPSSPLTVLSVYGRFAAHKKNPEI